jgi:hypothetical protein
MKFTHLASSAALLLADSIKQAVACELIGT